MSKTRVPAVDGWFTHDEHAPALLDAYLRWVQSVIERNGGHLLCVISGTDTLRSLAAWKSPGAVRAASNLLCHEAAK